MFPYRRVNGAPEATQKPVALSFPCAAWPKPAVLVEKPVAVIPAFPGTNCETDTARALERAGAEPRIVLVNNLSPDSVARSVNAMRAAISEGRFEQFRRDFHARHTSNG